MRRAVTLASRPSVLFGRRLGVSVRSPAFNPRSHEDGASSVEYGLLLALIAAVLIVTVLALGLVTGEMFSDTCSGVHGGISATGTPPTATC